MEGEKENTRVARREVWWRGSGEERSGGISGDVRTRGRWREKERKGQVRYGEDVCEEEWKEKGQVRYGKEVSGEKRRRAEDIG